MSGMVIVLTGPAAAGKSTIARTLQSALARDGTLWLVLELDMFGRGVPRNWVAIPERTGRYAERGFAYVRDDDGSVGLRLGHDGRRVLGAFHRSVAAVARSGVNVVCEGVLYDDADWTDWTEALEGLAVCWVKLAAPLEVLEARERADQTRALRGLARGMSARDPVGRSDVEADTALETADAIVQRIIASLPRDR
jgi:chloramphenicol 3-O phosphotransferase